jgi:hypothetical protein
MSTILGAYAGTTSVAQGESVTFRMEAADGAVPMGEVVVTDVATGEVRVTAMVSGPSWTLPVPPTWPSSLYLATFDTPEPVFGEAYFAVRAARPAESTRILVVVPFLTWQAYNHIGKPGDGLYLTEQPDRAREVTFDRPGGGSRDSGGWELPFYRWLADNGHDVDYCSNVDLHSGAAALERYQLLISPGHDEYWTWEMRDAVEAFVAAGGNFAVFSGNTCWWQARLEGDDLRTLVCYRDATLDPVATADPARTTVEWSSAPVNRPETSLIGVSWRRGAGCWEDESLMDSAAYTTRFADHWVFEGTGLRDGDPFGRGAVGYETDAVDFTEVDGVPWATGRDGAPPSSVILATADLRHWRDAGQGGFATMVTFQSGLGTVVNVATINWGNKLDDPVIARITDNVVRRLATRQSPASWADIGDCAGLVALAAAENLLYGVTERGDLYVRDLCMQNLRWRAVQEGDDIVALAAPRESDAGRPFGLYGLGRDGTLRFRPPGAEPAPWTPLGSAPDASVDLAVVFEGLFALTSAGELWYLHLRKPFDSGSWQRIDRFPGAVGITGLNGLLYLVDDSGGLHARRPWPDPDEWLPAGSTPGVRHLAGHAGRLIGGDPGGRLRSAGLLGGEPR